MAQRIQDRLRLTEKHSFPDFPGTWEEPINPDGPKAADYIDNALESLGHILKIAYDNIDDAKVRYELRLHAYSAIRGHYENKVVLRIAE